MKYLKDVKFLEIKRIITGNLEENCYILVNNQNALVIDPGDDFHLIKEELKNLNLIGILITHYHFDHVGALSNLLEYKKVPIYDYNLEEKKYNIKNFEFEIIKTKGHKEDSVTFYFKNELIMFTGDFIFKGTIGRTDLDGGNMKEMQESIEKIKRYNKEIILYPGHGELTTIEEEINNNYFFT